MAPHTRHEPRALFGIDRTRVYAFARVTPPLQNESHPLKHPLTKMQQQTQLLQKTGTGHPNSSAPSPCVFLRVKHKRQYCVTTGWEQGHGKYSKGSELL